MLSREAAASFIAGGKRSGEAASATPGSHIKIPPAPRRGATNRPSTPSGCVCGWVTLSGGYARAFGASLTPGYLTCRRFAAHSSFLISHSSFLIPHSSFYILHSTFFIFHASHMYGGPKPRNLRTQRRKKRGGTRIPPLILLAEKTFFTFFPPCENHQFASLHPKSRRSVWSASR